MSVQVEQKSYEMPPREGFTRHAFSHCRRHPAIGSLYEKVFGGRILSLGDGKGASGHIQIANTWLIVNVGGREYGEIRCYIRDPDGYIIEVGQSTDLTYG